MRKKNELTDSKEKYYKMETEYFTEKQKNMLMEEEVGSLRANLTRAERQLKEVQLRQQKNEGELYMKQLQLKTKENEAY